MLCSRTSIRVRYAETDMMGIVYHGAYLPWLEIGRTELLREHGVPYRELETAGFRLPVLEVSLKYHRPALYDDTVEVTTTLRDRPSVRIRLEYELRRGEELLVTGWTAHAFIDGTGRPVRPPARFAAAIAAAFGG